MLPTYFMLILAVMLHTFSVVNSNVDNFFTKFPILDENNDTLSKTPLEYLKIFDYKFESLSQIINKMDNTLQNLQEKSHTWIIFQHHINSWNEGLRILENKLDHLKRNYETQNHQLEKLEIAITNNNKISERYEFLLDDLKKFLITDRKNKNEISLKMNSILKHLQLLSVGNNVRKSSKKANIMAPIGISSLPEQCLCANITNKIDQRLNSLSQQMALQKDLRQLNSLEKRNSKSLENMNQVLSNQMGEYEKINTRIQKSNEICYTISSELSAFTKSSDIFLKRIEELFRNVSNKLNDIEVITDAEHNDYNENESQDAEHKRNFLDLDEYGDDEQNELEQEKSKGVILDAIDRSVTDRLEYDEINDVEFVRPMLSGCHELLDLHTDIVDDSVHIDGIYKFSTPNINQDERDFNERYCVFANDSGMPWTVIQRRGPYPQQENFNRSWSEYRNGFGSLSKDFWLGNEFIHRLVYHDDYELRIELEDFDGTQMWAKYAIFRIDSEENNYNLLIGKYQGTIEDAMQYHNDNDFSTYDKRNDKTVDACCSCAMGYASGWWFDNCSEANLNGLYHYTPLGHNYNGIIWELWRGDYSLKKTRMMIRPHKMTNNNTVVHSQDYIEDP